MISHFTIDKIIQAAKIEEVISEFVALKKAGANYTGLCPFHNEKTPSFHVSPSKNIYKCFGCGASGNTVKFLMDYEKISYPDALKWLAKKYNIIVEETEDTEEAKQKKSERDKILELLNFAQKYFTNILLNTDEGKDVGINYFYNNRKFDYAIIQKFQLGYSPQHKRSFTDVAIKAGFSAELLLKAGLVNYPDYQEGQPVDENKIYDKYYGRVIFPIADLSGKIIGFGGRTLSSDKNIAKYINSPQTTIYDKSKTLYGIHLAKKSMMQQDVCYLVEGYADVISMHKAGIENVVASSGTSLTAEQIKLIHRFTNNVVVLYDGDSAGIKAGIRAIDMLLEEGMHVKITLFPDGDDPDSFVLKNTPEQVADFLSNNRQDFIAFKQNLYITPSTSPAEKATAVEEIITSIARIPSDIQRRFYIKSLASDLKIEESALLRTMQKTRYTLYNKASAEVKPKFKKDTNATTVQKTEEEQVNYTEQEESDVVKYLIKYGNILINVTALIEGQTQPETIEISVCEYIVQHELKQDNLYFELPTHQLIIEEIEDCLKNNTIPEEAFFIHHPNPLIQSFAIKNTDEHILSPNWQKHGIHVELPIEKIEETVKYLILRFKEKKLRYLIKGKHEELKKHEEQKEHNNVLISVAEIKQLEEVKIDLNKRLGNRIILK